jgi:Domain of unknown function (DUF4410)
MRSTTGLRSSTSIALLLALGAASLWTPAASAATPGRLDDGLLDPSWFGPSLEFRTTEEIDYLWVKPGFDLQGHKLEIAEWSDPDFLSKKNRDNKDAAKAYELTPLMPGMIRGALTSALDGYAEVVKSDGDMVLTGRIVDCNAGNKAAKWLIGLGAGSATATWDIKITDKASGTLLAAIHHRSISGTTMSNIDDKIIKWLDQLGKAMRQDLSAYNTGKPAKK